MRQLGWAAFIFALAMPGVWGANPGDVIFSEVMWMGDFASPDNEWIELRNMTADAIDLKDWRISRFVFHPQPDRRYYIDMIVFREGILPPNGFFLIANSNAADSNLSVQPDLVAHQVFLADDQFQLQLFDANHCLIDVADDGAGTPAAGNKELRKSMVRKLPPQNGELASSWRTADTSSGWDEGATEYGTPTAANFSTTPALDVSALQLSFQLPEATQTLDVINKTGGKLQWGVFDAPVWVSVTPTTGTTTHDVPTPVEVTVLAEALQPNVHQGRFQIRNLTVPEQVRAIDVLVNRPPVVSPSEHNVVRTGRPIQMTVAATDPDGDRLTFTAQPIPESASFDQTTGTLLWTPTIPQEFTVQIQVKDDYGGLAEQTLHFEVILPPPYLIELQPLSDITQATDNPANGAQYRFQVSNNGTEADTVQLSVEADADNPPTPLIFTLAPARLNLQPEAEELAVLTVRGESDAVAGEYRFFVTATSFGDPEQRKHLTVTLFIRARPVFEVVPIFTDGVPTHTFYLSNPTQHPLEWNTAMPNWLTASPNEGVALPGETTQVHAEVDFSHLPPQTHEGVFTFLYDSAVNRIDQQAIPVFVNRRPSISAPTDVKHTANVPLELNIGLVDPDLDAVILAAKRLPDGARLTNTEVAPGVDTPQIAILTWDTPQIGLHEFQFDATDSLDASRQHTMTVEVSATMQWKITLKPNQPNPIHLPVRDPRFPTVSALFDHLRPNVAQILAYDPKTEAFRAYTGHSTRHMADDLTLAPHTGLVVVLNPRSESVEVIFDGVPYAAEGPLTVPIARGVNLIGLPLTDSRFTTPNDLKGHYPALTQMLGLDDAGQFTPMPLDAPLKGGQAFVVISETPVQLELSGRAWTQ